MLRGEEGEEYSGLLRNKKRFCYSGQSSGTATEEVKARSIPVRKDCSAVSELEDKWYTRVEDEEEGWHLGSE